MRLKREEEAKNKHNDRMKELLEKSSENKLTKEVESLQQLLSDEVSPSSWQRLPPPCTLQ
jgi:hypothetical protein